ncbi:MAG: c-type cytochrome biogenesis protein CcmI [Hasllibacter sp.]
MSIGFLVGALALAALSAAAILAAPRGGGADDAAMAIFRDQLAELDRDRAEGRITAAEYDAARAEIGRRMIREDRRDPSALREGSRAPLVVAALAVPALGLVLYAALGRPDLPAEPAALRAEERAATAAMAREADALAAGLAGADPLATAEDRLRLAQLRSALGQPALAAEALAPLAARDGAPSGILTLTAEALIQAEGVTPRARALVDRALRADPLNPAAAYYLAVLAEEDGETARAREILIRRLSLAPAEAPWMPSFAAAIDRLGAALGEPPLDIAAVIGTEAARVPAAVPQGGEGIAALPEAERAAAIRGMVEGLAARLADDGGTPAEWLRLATAREVLGEADAAAEAARAGLGALQDEPDPEAAAGLAAILARVAPAD